eukprot:CAMPEP_0181306582 /NCGR_PEP_ID=MMETSP1101-20121128/10383_1 /TAXON_ID=46948 /ORGANISM="Rhodomonas abbreviata, Strain Caron Lab Isolate" /LENGTH=271 /DNA_ID=CAMNT_0023412661 /DNA_START=248 /DNA_END=1060 /DNA_ORIENTATION=+
MALIEAYEEQYHALVSDINDKLDRLSKLESQGGASNDRWASTLAGAQQDIDDIDEVLNKLGMEIRSLKGETKASVQSRHQKYKLDAGVCKDTLAGVSRRGGRAAEEAERKELFSGHGVPDVKGSLSGDHRSRMTGATDRLETTTERIKESRKMARDTEMVGQDIMLELRQQRETLLHARDGVRDVDSNLGESRRLVKVMTQRMARNKCYMWTVLVVVVIIAVTIVFMQLTPSASSLQQQSSPSPLSPPSDPDAPPLIEPADQGVEPLAPGN